MKRRFAPARVARRVAACAPALVLALLAACGTAPKVGPGNVSRLPPGNAQRDGPEANPPSNLEAVPDAVPQIEQPRVGGPNKPYEIDGKTYVPITDGRAVKEKGLASWYGKKFHGRRTASGEAYNMYAMTAAHKTLPIPSYVRVRNPANGKEVIVRVNDRGPFSPNRVIDLSYTAALKLGVLGGVQPVEVERITDDDIRTGAAFRKDATQVAASPSPMPTPAPSDVPATGGAGISVADAVGTTLAAASDSAGSGSGAAVVAADAASQPPPREELARAETAAGAGFWVQLGAYRQRAGALDFQRRLIDEQPWLSPLLAVFSDGGMNRLQAGPYSTRDDAREAAERIRLALQLVPTIVEKR
jgi:rare lipoprotein A